MLVKDAMVVIHLAKMTLLQASCAAFGPVLIPPRVRDEVLAGKEQGYPDAAILEDHLQAGDIEVVDLGPEGDRALSDLDRLSVRGGEAEAVALCWQEDIERLATDDDNVRDKQEILRIRCVGTPALLLSLYKRGAIDRPKLSRALDTLERIGWFSQPVLDKIRMEAERWDQR